MREPGFMVEIYCKPPLKRRAAVAFKYLVILILLLIIASLGKALFHLSSSEPGNSGKMLKALSWRIGLSVLLFVMLLIAYTQGWIEPQHVR
jgi:hypothetical protein